MGLCMRHTGINIVLIWHTYIVTVYSDSFGLFFLLPQLRPFFINPDFHHDISISISLSFIMSFSLAHFYTTKYYYLPFAVYDAMSSTGLGWTHWYPLHCNTHTFGFYIHYT